MVKRGKGRFCEAGQFHFETVHKRASRCDVSISVRLVTFCASVGTTFRCCLSSDHRLRRGSRRIRLASAVAAAPLAGSGKKASDETRSPRLGRLEIFWLCVRCERSRLWYHSCFVSVKRPRPSFFLQTKPRQGLSITRTPEGTQQKAWGKALIFRSPFFVFPAEPIGG